MGGGLEMYLSLGFGDIISPPGVDGTLLVQC